MTVHLNQIKWAFLWGRGFLTLPVMLSVWFQNRLHCASHKKSLNHTVDIFLLVLERLEAYSRMFMGTRFASKNWNLLSKPAPLCESQKFSEPYGRHFSVGSKTSWGFFKAVHRPNLIKNSLKIQFYSNDSAGQQLTVTSRSQLNSWVWGLGLFLRRISRQFWYFFGNKYAMTY